MSWILDEARAQRDGFRHEPVVRDDRARTSLARLRADSRAVTIDGRTVVAVSLMGSTSRWRCSDEKITEQSMLVLDGIIDTGVHR